MYRMNTSISAPEKLKIEKEIKKLSKILNKKGLEKLLLVSEVELFNINLKKLEDEMDAVKDNSFSYVYNFKIYKKMHTQKIKKEDKIESLSVHIMTIREMIARMEKMIN
jgi:hypothetical protein